MLKSPASGMSIRKSQVLATVMSGSPPPESASAIAACVDRSSAGSRDPARHQGASAASPTAISAPPANSATAIRWSGSWPPIKASNRNSR